MSTETDTTSDLPQIPGSESRLITLNHTGNSESEGEIGRGYTLSKIISVQ